MYFPRVIRLDASDERVYEPPARPGEWAVPGAFAFLDLDSERLDGKQREAFRHGFLGTETFGWSTLVEVEEISEADYAAAIERLAMHLLQNFGAPNLDAARTAAREEAAFAEGICGHPRLTLLALERQIGTDGIEESFRVVKPPSGLDHARIKIWTVEDE